MGFPKVLTPWSEYVDRVKREYMRQKALKNTKVPDPTDGVDACNVEANVEGSVPDPTTVRGLTLYEDDNAGSYELRALGYGIVRVPEDWGCVLNNGEYVPSELMKGLHWNLGRFGDSLYAPIAAIEAVEADLREAVRERDAGQSFQYAEVKEACVKVLGFAPEHRELADHIADAATQMICERGDWYSGRGRPADFTAKALLACRTRILKTLTGLDDPWAYLDKIIDEKLLHCDYLVLQEEEEDRRDGTARSLPIWSNWLDLAQAHDAWVDRILAKFRDRSGAPATDGDREAR